MSQPQRFGNVRTPIRCFSQTRRKCACTNSSSPRPWAWRVGATYPLYDRGSRSVSYKNPPTPPLSPPMVNPPSPAPFGTAFPFRRGTASSGLRPRPSLATLCVHFTLVFRPPFPFGRGHWIPFPRPRGQGGCNGALSLVLAAAAKENAAVGDRSNSSYSASVAASLSIRIDEESIIWV